MSKKCSGKTGASCTGSPSGNSAHVLCNSTVPACRLSATVTTSRNFAPGSAGYLVLPIRTAGSPGSICSPLILSPTGKGLVGPTGIQL